MSSPRSRGRCKWLAIGVVVVLIPVVGLLSIRYWRDLQIRWLVAEIERCDPGWRLADLEASREDVPDDENSALLVLAADNTLAKGSLGTAAFDLSEAIRILAANVPLQKQQLAQVQTTLSTSHAAVKMLRDLKDTSRGRYPIRWQDDGIGTLIPHADANSRLRLVTYLDTVLCSEQGDASGALQSARALLLVGRLFGDEPTPVAQRMRAKYHEEFANGLERILARDSCPDATLASLQPIAEIELKAPLLLTAARGDRALVHAALTSFEKGRIDRRSYGLRNPFGINSLWADQAFNALDADTARAAHVEYLRYLDQVVQIVQLPIDQQMARLKALERPKVQLPELLAGLIRNDDESQIAASFHRAHAKLLCASVALAVERYRTRHQSWPESLQSLVPEYLGSLPIDPYDGQPLRYRRLDDGVSIYAIGPDGHNDGGQTGGDHIGFRLWDLDQRLALRKQHPNDDD